MGGLTLIKQIDWSYISKPILCPAIIPISTTREMTVEMVEWVATYAKDDFYSLCIQF
jgi:hypothetical protein